MVESLENNELILLMYLAGELPAVDREEVAQMLVADAGLRRELEQMRAMYGAMETGLAALDQAEPLPSEAMAVHRIGRAMRQRLAFRAAEAARNVKPASRLVLPWWAYPSIAAAAIFIAFLTWVITFNFGTQHHTTLVEAPIAPNVGSNDGDNVPAPSTNPTSDNSAQLVQEIESSFGPSTEKEDNQMFALSEDPQSAGGGDKND
jgi:hypothetical protein